MNAPAVKISSAKKSSSGDAFINSKYTIMPICKSVFKAYRIETAVLFFLCVTVIAYTASEAAIKSQNQTVPSAAYCFKILVIPFKTER